MSQTSLLVPTFQQMLKALANWLAKAEKGAETSNDLLSARLAPDMYPLATQVRFSCLQAYEGVHRLRGEALPKICEDLLEEGRNGGAAPGTFADSIARIEATLNFLDDLSKNALDGQGDRQITIELSDAMILDMTGDEFVRDWALPQFYFHVMTAYAILRAQSVPLGKPDYVHHALAYLRPESA